ncbi:DUF1028 domain-containing protein [Synechococcus sp. CCY9201]|jgi:uncharacterized Ntn-hydrolase superfamily protein|uniref:DUF1028 domain-containing protein n=1 Tax=unclassified Synechococcus TaxID=2626047 RepID=UPI0018CDA232|nr:MULTISPECIES: DUF1028 domain-containing protein [unclassified Synechococcus]MEA5475643.1 DUF1028 domain-containing protein [Synechococcus sp. CCY9201]QPN59174.1 DUF1028 domain-containing protein [Synechococcus sp. CBW1002]
MTYSIVAWDPSTGMTGVAVATKHLAVGSLVPHARAGVGAVATQSSTNPLLGPWGLDRLTLLRGTPQPVSVAQTVLDSLMQDDPGRDHRQVHLVDADGRAAAWTGAHCGGWAGHHTGEGYSVAGNFLTGPEPVQAMAAAYEAALAADLPFSERLMRALEAGEAAGGDHRGRQSAALYVMHQELYPLHDFRVDHHPDPLVALREILAETTQPYYTSFRDTLPVLASLPAPTSAFPPLVAVPSSHTAAVPPAPAVPAAAPASLTQPGLAAVEPIRPARRRWTWPGLRRRVA